MYDLTSFRSPQKSLRRQASLHPKSERPGTLEEKTLLPRRSAPLPRVKLPLEFHSGPTKMTSGDITRFHTVANSVDAADAVTVKSESDTAESQGRSIERPSTPEAQAVKEAKTPKTPKTPKSADVDNVVEANDATPKQARAKTQPVKPKANPKQSPIKGKRTGAEKVADKVVLPTKWSEASEADKTLVRMKEAGHPWSDIRTKWYEMTGQDTAPSTLPNR